MSETYQPLLKGLEERIDSLGHVDVTPYGLAPWSASKTKVLLHCPLQFYLAYIVKFRIVKIEDPDEVLRRNVGTAAHYILEKMIDGYRVADAYKMAQIRYMGDVTPERWHHVEALLGHIKAFNFRLFEFEERVPLKYADSERKVAVDKSFTAVDFDSPDAFLRGIIDLSMRTQTNDAIILDHKYGGTSAWGLRNYRFQLNMCSILEHFGNEPVRGVQTGIHFMEAGQVALSEYISRMMLEEAMTGWVIKRIETAVVNVLERGEFSHKRGGHCIYCPYKELCSAGPRGTCGELRFAVEKSRLICKG